MRFMSTAVIISTLSMGCAGAGASGLTESVTVVAPLQALETTLKHLNEVQTQLMIQVFKK